jgi:hypothetical protein
VDNYAKAQNNIRVEMNTFLIINGVIVALVVISLFNGRKGPRAPTTLQLRNGPDHSKANPQRDVSETKLNQPQEPPQLSKPPGWQNYRPRHVSISAVLDHEKSLNVMFNWNGHSWDAYEVLGIPAGSSPPAVIAAYNRLKQTCEPETVPFLEAAARAILNS